MKWWLVVGLETSIEWPVVETEVAFEGHKLLLRPSVGDCYPDVAMQYEHPTGKTEAIELASRFLSLMTWEHRRPTRIMCSNVVMSR